ncbi:growth factor receptor-bound protein 14 isoform X2 [Parasteatoda tepidariorum]|uniref:growth factor receptor-bound protein 14 isoform X2 n=1 Tax=Parasteatoda tepidariorum TaxID=114398 RepID=UPI00077FBAAA|nr:growth factor receptor-bound protein 14 isoform X2 [Parasteatoda tepidariorum]
MDYRCRRCRFVLSLLNNWCGKPKEGDISYQLLLGTSASSVESDTFSSYASQKSASEPREVALNFYTEDGKQQRLVVEENLRVLDLCQLLALKFNVSRSPTWTLAEQLTSLGIERSLEDHEDILQVYASWNRQKETSENENKFIFKQDFCKYEFFRTPQQFFPLSMLDLGSIPLDCLSESPDLAKFVTLQNILNNGEKSPVVQSLLWCKEPGKESWKRIFFRIEGSTLCFSNSSYSSKDGKQQFWPFRDLTEYEIYTPIENSGSATPTSYSFCLKNTSFPEEDTRNLLWLCCESEKHRQCWIVALRLAKYGRKIRENYKEVLTRYADSPVTSMENRVSSSVDSLPADYTPMKPRVAMDFTGSQSRVVEDPREAKAIEAAEGHTWKRRLPYCRAPGGNSPQNLSSSPSARPQSDMGVHFLQPWFYRGMSRDEATHLLTKYGTVDGVFLVRESRRNPGSFVLSYVYKNKVHHCQIFQVDEKDQLCYSLDSGRTKFYDLIQLVEFYQLNVGSLPTKLTHFLVHRPRSNGQAENTS